MLKKKISSPLLLEGKTLKSSILSQIKERINQITTHFPAFLPRLEILLVGDDPSSLTYVAQKKLSGESIGIRVGISHFPGNIPQEKLVEKLEILNKDPLVHGILVQLPLPKTFNTPDIVLAIDPKKDVDGIHPLNMGFLLDGNRPPFFIPATPLGILKILDHYEIPVCQKNVVILNRSNIVGKPLACLLGSKKSYGNATVTLCHRQTRDISDYTKMADILITATSAPHSLTEDVLKPGSVVVDLGQFVQIRDGKRYITGDVLWKEDNSHLGAITPVPGGVGPMTVASLMENIFKASVYANNIPSDLIDYDFF